jgi:hypothetical protein
MREGRLAVLGFAHGLVEVKWWDAIHTHLVLVAVLLKEWAPVGFSARLCILEA